MDISAVCSVLVLDAVVCVCSAGCCCPATVLALTLVLELLLVVNRVVVVVVVVVVTEIVSVLLSGTVRTGSSSFSTMTVVTCRHRLTRVHLQHTSGPEPSQLGSGAFARSSLGMRPGQHFRLSTFCLLICWASPIQWRAVFPLDVCMQNKHGDLGAGRAYSYGPGADAVVTSFLSTPIFAPSAAQRFGERMQDIAFATRDRACEHFCKFLLAPCFILRCL